MEVKGSFKYTAGTPFYNKEGVEIDKKDECALSAVLYEVEDEKEMIEDVETLAEGMRLLQYDYIGGSGSRGYGKIAFENIIAETVVGEVSEELLAQCNKILSQAIQE